MVDMIHVVKKSHIKTKKKEDNRGKEEEEEAAEDRGQPINLIELEIRLPHTEIPILDDADMVEADDRTEKATRTEITEATTPTTNLEQINHHIHQAFVRNNKNTAEGFERHNRRRKITPHPL